MGLILDSSVIVAAERGTQSVSELLDSIRTRIGVTEILLSAISVIELEHGVWRARTSDQAQQRRAYLDAVFAAIPVEPFTRELAQLAGRLDAESRRQGVVIPFADLQVGVTALHYGYSLATLNERHFRLIPGLVVTRL